MLARVLSTFLYENHVSPQKYLVTQNLFFEIERHRNLKETVAPV